MPIDTTYQLKPGETVEQYNARVAAYNATKSATQPQTTQSPQTAIDTNYQLKPGETVEQYNARVAQYNATKSATQQPITQPAATPSPTAPVDTNYQLKPGETIDQYNQRVAAYNASKTQPTTPQQPAQQPVAQPTPQPVQPPVQPPPQPTQPGGIPQITNNLTPGSKGAEVEALQRYLISQGYSIPALQNGATPYGFYGEQTTAAVAQWQKAQGLNITDPSQYGYFGPISRAALQKSQTAIQPQQPQQVTPPSLLEQTIESFRKLYGLAPKDPNKTATQSAIDDYKAIYTSLGIPDIKKSYQDSVDAFAKVQNELSDKIAGVNENPWLSEGVRLKEVGNLKDRYETKLAIETNKMQLYQSLVSQAQAQADDVMRLMSNQQTAERDAVNHAIDFTQKQIDAQRKLTEIDPARFREVQGGLFDIKEGKWLVQPSPSSKTSNIATDNERALFTNFRNEPIVKDYNTILAKKLSVDAIIQNGVGGPGDLALVFEFMKALDPNSVVRETEYATAAKSGNIFLGAYAKYNGYLKEKGGFLPPQVRTSFQSIVNSKLKVQQQLFDNLANEYRLLAARQGLNPQNVVIGYDQVSAQSYPSGTRIVDNGIVYQVQADGKTIIPIANAL